MIMNDLILMMSFFFVMIGSDGNPVSCDQTAESSPMSSEVSSIDSVKYTTLHEHYFGV